jgi:methylase of polypeptide subunit release factors
MRSTNAGTIRPSIHEKYVKALGCRNTTFVVPKDTNALCRLVELIARPNTVVVDLGCGDGIPTIHAAACGARRVLGVEINPLAIANTRTNTARVLLPAGTLDVVQIDMLQFLGNRSIRDEIFARLGLLGDTVDLVFSNPPYVPIPDDPESRPRSANALARAPATDLSVLGAADTLIDRIMATRSAMMATENGGPDGLRFIRELVTCVPRFANRLAWLQGSYSSPLIVLASLPPSGWIIEHLVAYAARFGKYSMTRDTPQSRHLNALRDDGRSFFWSASPDGPHWFIVLGFAVRRSKPPAGYDWNAVIRALEELLRTFTVKGPNTLVHGRLDLPFAMEIGIYDES